MRGFWKTFFAPRVGGNAWALLSLVAAFGFLCRASYIRGDHGWALLWCGMAACNLEKLFESWDHD